MSATRPTPAEPLPSPIGPGAPGEPPLPELPRLPVEQLSSAATQLVVTRPPLASEARLANVTASPVQVDRALAKECPACGGKFPEDFNVCPRDATPLAWAGSTQGDPLVGATLADTYLVVKMLGEGGMGRVYEVRHTRLSHRRYALKVLHPEYARHPEIVSRFQREAEAAAKVVHPNVLEVYDVGRTEDGRPYLVSELLEGEELGQVAKRKGKLDVPSAVSIVRQACAALGEAHRLNVVHRDVKPENLYLVGDEASPRVKVIDFGISKIGDHEGSNLTRTGVVMGTPAYMPPEQARGERVDARADVYATGAILYRLLTGRTPFDTDDVSAALTAVLTEQPPRPRSLSTQIPEALELVIERAMAKDASERFSSMEALDRALAPFDQAGSQAVVPAGSSGTTLVGAARPPEAIAQLAQATREAQLARPTIVVGSLLMGAGLSVALADAVAGAVLLVTRDPALSSLNAALLMGGVAATALMPLVLYVRHVALNVWTSSVRSVELAGKLRSALVVGFGSYGALSLALRFAEGLIMRTPAEISWAGWSVLLFVVSACAAALAASVTKSAGR